jgi:hypothetical protein
MVVIPLGGAVYDIALHAGIAGNVLYDKGAALAVNRYVVIKIG